jgi:hypothetical protein
MLDYSLQSDAEGEQPKLDTTYFSSWGLGIGNNGYGIYVDGQMGGLHLNGTFYKVRQIHFQLPSWRRVRDLRYGQQPVQATGEIHITHQKDDGKGTSHLHQDGIAILVIPLVLPLEGGKALPTKTEEWFVKKGFTTLPVEGGTLPIIGGLDLNVFDEQLNGPFTWLNPYCQEVDMDGSLNSNKPQWYLLHKPAYITGAAAQAFKDAFPYSLTEGKYSLTPDMLARLRGNRNTLVGIAQAREEEENSQGQLSDVARWMAAEDWVAGTGEYMPLGEWWLPPPTPAPTPSPTVTPTPAPPTRGPPLGFNSPFSSGGNPAAPFSGRMNLAR